jgi:acyl carrier protein
MPGTAIVEMIRAGFHELTGEPGAEITDLVLRQPLMVTDGMRALLEYSPTGEGQFLVSLVSGSGQDYSTARIGTLPHSQARVHDLDGVRAVCGAAARPFNLDALEVLEFGPRWQGIEERLTGQRTDLVTVELRPEFRADLEQFYLHPSVFDLCLIGQDISGSGEYLPFSYGRILIRGPLPSRVHSIARHHDDTLGEVISTDFTLVDEAGNELVEIERYTMVQLTGQELQQAERNLAAMAATGSSDSLVSAAEAGAALLAILASDVGPQVIWCPEGLGQRIRRVSQVTRSQLTERLTAAGGTMTAVPRHRTVPYVEPSTTLERAVAALWSEVLGVDQVGAEDTFQDLGGNSLFAVQLVSLVSQHFGVRATVSLLFEAQTVRVLAQRISELRLDADPEPAQAR